MQEVKASSSATTIIAPSQMRIRHIPDVPEDVDFILEHLNDPNYDLRRSSTVSFSSGTYELDFSKRASTDQNVSPLDFKTSGSDYDTESHHEHFKGTRSSRASAIDFDDESPYPEVRAAVPTIDDHKMPVNTFRAWFLGILFSVLISGLNQIFSMRFPTMFITGIVVQLLSLPMGKGLASILPATQFRTFGYQWSFNPGPFNVKEHVVITVMATSVVLGAYTTDVVAAQRVFYGHVTPFSYQILLALGSQLLGYSFAGIFRQFLIWPSCMIWPGALVNTALYNTLHKNYHRQESKHMSRQKFFFIVLTASFLWYWLPGLLWTGLSFFTWVCWIAPNNVVVNQLFGGITGLGMSSFTLDWSMISFLGSPLVTPWWSEANTITAFVVLFWILTPILYYTNTWYSKYLPMSANIAFDNTGHPYNPKAIFTNGTFDVEKYRAYSPVFLSPTQALGYGIAFAAFSSVIVHSFLWYRQDIMRRLRSSLKDERDVHSRLMLAYPEVPRWWYAALGISSFVLLVISIHLFPTDLPVWALLISILISGSLILPIGMIQAITNQPIPLQVIGELIGGYILPNKPVANMIFKATTFLTSWQAIQFSGNLKLGHYMKVPPRIMFMAQTVSVIVACFVVTLVQDWMFNNIPDFCTPHQKNGFVCRSTKSFATASLVWGGIGPYRLFSPGALYSSVLWFFLVGALAPIPFYFLAFRYPLSIWRYVNIPVCFAGVAAIPPATGLNYSAWAVAGFIFQFFMRRYHFRWWMRYNYILSAGLDAGVAIALVAVFLFVQLPNKNGVNISWWGNDVWQKTADALGTPLRVLKDGETFGPPTGSWL